MGVFTSWYSNIGFVNIDINLLQGVEKLYICIIVYVYYHYYVFVYAFLELTYFRFSLVPRYVTIKHPAYDVQHFKCATEGRKVISTP